MEKKNGAQGSEAKGGRKKVLMLLTNPFRPDPRVHEEALALIEGGYDVSILCWDRGEGFEPREIVDGIDVLRISIPSSYGRSGDFFKGLFKFYWRALKYARKMEFDIIHANDFDTLPLGVMLKYPHGSKLVYDAHDDYASMIADVMPPSIHRTISGMERFLLRYTDGRIAASAAIARQISEEYRFTTVLNAKNLKEFVASPEKVGELRKKLAGDGDFLIVYIGILKIWTPLPHLIDAVKHMDGVRLVIGGKGPHEKEILEMIDGITNISYIGWVKKEDIPLYTLASDLVVLPSNSKKAYTRASVPNKIMEGMAAGKPVIAGKNTEAGSIVKECNAGLLCEYGDSECIREAIKKLMQDRELYETLGRNGRRCAEEKYNWGIMKGRLLDLYRSLE